MVETTLVYDDDCGFCTWWAEFFAERSDVPIVGFAELTPELRDHLPEHYEDCSHLVTDEQVYSCGASIEEAFVRSDVGDGVRSQVEFLRNFRDYERVREHAYQWVADNRSLLGQVFSKTPPVRRESEDER